MKWKWKKLFVAVIIASLISILRHTGCLLYSEWIGIDLLFNLHPSEPPDPRIVIVGFTKTDMEALGDSRLSDRQLAQLVNLVKQGKPRAIGLDIIRDHPVPPGHQELLEVFQSTPYLYGIGKQTGIIGDPDFDTITPPPIPSQQITDVSVSLDGDDVQRRVFFYPISQDRLVPSLGFALACEYLKADGITAKKSTRGGLLDIGKATFYEFSNNSGPYVRTNDNGYQTLMNWRKATFTMFPVREVLSGRVSPQVFGDRLVFIGGYSSSLGDQYLIPFSRSFNASPRKMFGVEAQAQLASMVLAAVLDDRPIIKVWYEPWISLWIVLWGVIGFWCASDRRWWQTLCFATVISCALFVLCYLAFLYSAWLIPLIPPFIALNIVTGAIAIADYERERYQNLKRLESWNKTLEEELERRTQIIRQQQIYKIISAIAIDLERHLTYPLQRLSLLTNSIQQQETKYELYLKSSTIQHPEIQESLNIDIATFATTVEAITNNLEQVRTSIAIVLPELSNYVPQPSLSQLEGERQISSLDRVLERLQPLFINEYKVDLWQVLNTLSIRQESFKKIDEIHLTLLLGIIFNEIFSQTDSINNVKIVLVIGGDPQELSLKVSVNGKILFDDIIWFKCQNVIHSCQGEIVMHLSDCITEWIIDLPIF